MNGPLPILFALGAGLALVAAIAAIWQSLRTAFAPSGAATDLPLLTTDKRATLIDQKNALLRNIKDLEFERQVGKISEKDFERLDAIYRARAREVLAALDAEVGEWRAEAEKLVAKVASEVKVAVAKEKGEVAPPEPREAEVFRAAPRRCENCETFNDPDATFCKKCATRLVPEEPPPEAAA